MAHTFEIGCEQCRVSLWIGQGSSLDRFQIYTSPDMARRTSDFFKVHAGHPLKFFDTDARPDDVKELSEEDDDKYQPEPGDHVSAASAPGESLVVEQADGSYVIVSGNGIFQKRVLVAEISPHREA